MTDPPAPPPGMSAAPAAPAVSSAPSASAAPVATAVVRRPEPGLARGVWEAPRWAFVVIMGLLIVSVAVYAARRAGLLRRKQRS